MPVPAARKFAPAPAKAAPAPAPVKAVAAKAAPAPVKAPVKAVAPKPKAAPPPPEPEVDPLAGLDDAINDVEAPAEEVAEEAPVEEEVAVEEELPAEEAPEEESDPLADMAEEPAPPPVRPAPAKAKALPAKALPAKTVPAKAPAKPARPAPVAEEPVPQGFSEGSWDDPATGGYTGLKRFKPNEAGTRYRIRFMPWKKPDGTLCKQPAKFEQHQIDLGGGSFLYAMHINHPSCPGCVTYGKATIRTKWVMPMVHISSQTKAGTQMVGDICQFVMPGKKIKLIQGTILPDLVEQGKGVTDSDILLYITEGKTQEGTFSLPQKSILSKEMVAAYRAEMDRFTEWLRTEFTVEAIQNEIDRKTDTRGGKGKGGGKGAGKGFEDGEDNPWDDAPKGRARNAAPDDADSALDALGAELGG